ncbi:MAG: beta-lactamase family protein [Pseudomonadales bacterium]|nr:beta-lactamase family protein [Pseudomonadales bacterium]
MNFIQAVCRVPLTVFILATLSSCDRIPDLPIGKGFSAKYLCSYVFNTGLDPNTVTKRFIKPKVEPLPLIWGINIDYEAKSVTVRDFVFLNEELRAKAIYREGMGCTLLVDKSIDELSDPITPIAPPAVDANTPWPHGSAGLNSRTDLDNLQLDNAQLEEAVATAFTEPAEAPRNTTSFLVAYKGKLIAEKYAYGVTPNSPVLGWSMTKSVSASLVGILSQEGVIDINDPAPIPAWSGTDKAAITIRDILHMSSGLDYVEDYGGESDVSKMLYTQSDQVAYASARALLHPPGTVFNYSTGDANLLGKIIQDSVGGTAQDAYNFYQLKLFHKIGVTSAFIEVDTTGQFVGGAYGFMSPRDWLRLGQLYLQEGSWQGEQIISKEWIEFATSPSPVSPEYGAQIWLNTNGNVWPQVPSDAYYFAGHQGQRVVVIPSKELVIVRTGVTENYDYIGLDKVIPMIIAAISDQT